MKDQSTIAFKTRKTSTMCSLVAPHFSIPKIYSIWHDMQYVNVIYN